MIDEIIKIGQAMIIPIMMKERMKKITPRIIKTINAIIPIIITNGRQIR